MTGPTSNRRDALGPGVKTADRILKEVQDSGSDLDAWSELSIHVPPKEQRLQLFTPAEVACVFRVDPKTVTRWHTKGIIDETSAIRTPGNHRRYLRSWIENQLRRSGVKGHAIQMVIEQGLARHRSLGAGGRN